MRILLAVAVAMSLGCSGVAVEADPADAGTVPLDSGADAGSDAQDADAGPCVCEATAHLPKLECGGSTCHGTTYYVCDSSGWFGVDGGAPDCPG